MGKKEVTSQDQFQPSLSIGVAWLVGEAPAIVFPLASTLSRLFPGEHWGAALLFCLGSLSTEGEWLSG